MAVSVPSSDNVSIVRGMIIMALAMLFAPGMDVLAKYLGTEGNVSPGVVTFGRFLTQGIVLGLLLSLLVAVGRKKKLLPTNLYGNLLRGALMGLAAFLFFTAVTFMPVADAISIFFVEPFIVTILSAMFLGEVVGWRRTTAVLIGFGGALLVIQPSFEKVGFVALLPICTAFVFAIYLILTRKIAASNDDPFAMQFAAGLGGTVFMLFAIGVGGEFLGIPALRAEFPATISLWAMVISIGLIGSVTHLMIVFACASVPASIIAPFQYLEIVSATLLGFLVFSDFPNAIKWVGIFIIIGSGIFIFMRERENARTTEELR